jgi:hypothetical protein
MATARRQASGGWGGRGARSINGYDTAIAG